MKRRFKVLFLSALVATAGSALASGVVQVSFADVQQFTDVGTMRWEQEGNLKTLARHFEKLGERHLSDGETLMVEILDVDLAGAVRPLPGGGNETRVVTGGADWPRISVRFSLQRDGKLVRSGTEVIADMNYSRGSVGMRDSEPLQYEKVMIEKWFKANFGK